MTYLKILSRRHFPECALGTTPRGLTTNALAPTGSSDTAPASKIFEIASERNSAAHPERSGISFGISAPEQPCFKTTYSHSLSNLSPKNFGRSYLKDCSLRHDACGDRTRVSRLIHVVPLPTLIVSPHPPTHPPPHPTTHYLQRKSYACIRAW